MIMQSQKRMKFPSGVTRFAGRMKDSVVRTRAVHLLLIALVLFVVMRYLGTRKMLTTIEWMKGKSRPGAVTCPNEVIFFRDLNSAVALEVHGGKAVRGQLPEVIIGNIHPFATKQRGIFDLPPQRVKFKKVLGVDVSDREKWSPEQWSHHADGMLERHVDKGWLILALVNYAMREMTMNYLASLVVNGYDKYVLMCFDFKMYRFLVEHGFGDHATMAPSNWMHNIDIGGEFLGWSDSKYNLMLHGKMMLVIEILRKGYTLFYHDVDLVLTSPYVVDVLQAEDATINADFTYMSDSTHDTAGDVMNGGFWVAKPSKIIISWWERALALSMTDKTNAVDQYALNHVLDTELAGMRWSRNFRAMSRALFPSGFFVHKKQFNEKFNIYPLVIHVNWLVGNPPKKAALRQLNLWFIGEDFASSG